MDVFRLALVWSIFFNLLMVPSASADFADAARYNADADGVSFVVMQAGEILFEDYPNGGDRSAGHNLASGTKSFSGVIAAAAAQDGLLDLDERAADTLAEWQDDPQKSLITVRQLLQLVSGIDGGRLGRPPAYADAIDAELAAAPGTRFSYGPVPFQIFGEIMNRKLAAVGSDEDPSDYLNRRVLRPIGLEIESWRVGRDGNPMLPQGIAITARNWALFGEFVRLGGEWQNEQLVDTTVLESFFAGSEANPTYGLTWWIDDEVSAGQRSQIRQLGRVSGIATGDSLFPHDLVMAAGAGDQRLYISRSEELVIVRQAPLRGLLGSRSRYSDLEFWRALRN
jgi:CubicO group peptidase (beta-lactamase class C family)